MALSLRDEVNGPRGVSTNLSASSDDLALIRKLIEEQWLACLSCVAPQHVAAFAELGCERYHELAHAIDHSSVWPKRSRILPAEAVATIRTTSLLRQLVGEFGEFAISDEDGIGWEEVYWRLVRPNAANDVGPLHADQWFWELGDATVPADSERVNCWIAIITEPDRNGLLLVPGSHRRDWRFHGETRHGSLKPQIDEDEAQFELKLLPLAPGGAVVFHDKLLHRGALNDGNTTRVSLEFTMFVKKQRLRWQA
jgi:hypothetical protein